MKWTIIVIGCLVLLALIVLNLPSYLVLDGSETASTKYELSFFEQMDKEQKALKGDADAALVVAQYYAFAEENYEKAFPWFKLAAKNGNSEAKSFLKTQYDKTEKPL